MIVTKEMHDEELQTQYGQFRFLVSMNSRKWGLKIMNGLVRLTKGQKVKGVINQEHNVASSHTKGHKIRTRAFRPEGTSSETLPAMIYFHGGGYFLIEKAKNSLLNSSDTISGVAYSLGFEYPQHFSNLFKSKTGFSPKEYRHLN